MKELPENLNYGIRTTTQIRQVGLSKLRLTIKWRVNPDLVANFLHGAVEHKESYFIGELGNDLLLEYGLDWICPEKVEKWDEIRHEGCGMIIMYRSAERVEPLVLPSTEEWMQYDNIQIGVSDDEPVFLEEEDLAAHVQIIGASRFGKSKLIEYVARQFIAKYPDGVCVLDPNQQLYDDLLNWSIHRRYGNIHFIDPSDERNTVGFNPFRLQGNPTPQRITARANRLLRTTLKALNIHGDTAIQAQRIIRCLYYVVIEQNLPITELKAFFTPRLFNRRDEIMSRCGSEDVCDQWQMLVSGKKDDAYLSMMQSSANRLFEFVSEGGVQRLFTNPHTLDFAKVTASGGIVVINLGKSDMLPTAARNVIGTFLIDEIWDVMSSRTKEQVEKIPPFNLMVDEFQNFATPDFAEMLKEGAKYRLRLWLINHVLSDLDRNVKNALISCHTRIAFGGTMQQDAAFVLEGSEPQEGSEVKFDVEIVPRLSKREFMLRRPGLENVICDTAEVKTFPVNPLRKEHYLDAVARQPAERKEQTEAQEPPPSTKKQETAGSDEQAVKSGDVTPDEFYY